MTETLPTEHIVLGRVVDLTRLSSGAYEGLCHGGWVRTRGYGGAVLAQGVGAAIDAVEPDRSLHSLHAYFIAAVDPAVPTRFRVTPLREGSNYTVCRVEGTQGERTVFTMNASFKRTEPSAPRRAPQAPVGIPDPEACSDGFADRGPDSPIARVLENRASGGLPGAVPGELRRANWLRMRHALGDDPGAHVAALVYLSDVTLAPTAFGVEPGAARPEGAVLGSLDHALWLHVAPAKVRADEWLCFVQSSRLEEDGRAFARGELWTRHGVLIASVAQEALIRNPRPTHHP